MKYNYIILLIIICSSIIYADFCNPAFEDCPSSDDEPSPEEQLQDQLNSNPSSASSEDLMKYPDIAKDNWDKLEDNQKNDLYKNDLDTFKDKFSEDWAAEGVDVTVADGSSYDPDTKVLTNPDGSTINLANMKNNNIRPIDGGVAVNDNQYQSATNIHGNPDGSVTADMAVHVQAGGTSIDDAVGVTIYPAGGINVGYASVIQDGTTFVYDADDYNNDGIGFSVNGAASVVSEDCLYFYNVKDATFRFTNDNGEIITDSPFNMTDCMDVFSELSPSGTASIGVNKFPSIYNISNSTILIGNESFVSNNSAVITADELGMGCISITPPGTYYHTYEDIRRDFAIYVYKDKFSFCIRKDETAYPMPADDNEGLVDLVDNRLYINGQAEYMRYPFNEVITSFDFMNVYDGIEPDARMSMELD